MGWLGPTPIGDHRGAMHGSKHERSFWAHFGEERRLTEKIQRGNKGPRGKGPKGRNGRPGGKAKGWW
jgi:hypothetical protein